MNLTEENQTFIDTWAKERTKGQAYFIGKVTLSYLLGLILVHLLLNFQEVTSVGIAYFLEGIRLFVYVGIGLCFSFYRWSKNEEKYHRLQEEIIMPTV